MKHFYDLISKNNTLNGYRRNSVESSREPFSGRCGAGATAFPAEPSINRITVFEILQAVESGPETAEGFKMKKVLLALTAVAAFSGSAFAADLAPHYTKAPPPMAVAPSWTGFYIFGGVGGGLWEGNNIVKNSATLVPLMVNQQQGGNGWFGTVGAGYDWQFGGNWVAGILADGQFGSLRGSFADPVAQLTGGAKLEDTWAVGARVGYLVAPNVLSYVSGGWTGSNWSGSVLTTLGGTPSGLHTNGFTTNSGWFVGGGVENNLNIFGITAPGWFMKTEYRAAYYSNRDLGEFFDGTNTLGARAIGFSPIVQTVSTSLVYRFNWGGPAVPNY
jgi:outer membrane immunogenic protein